MKMFALQENKKLVSLGECRDIFKAWERAAQLRIPSVIEYIEQDRAEEWHRVLTDGLTTVTTPEDQDD